VNVCIWQVTTCPRSSRSSGLPLRRPSLREVARVAGLLRSLAGEDEMETTCDPRYCWRGPSRSRGRCLRRFRRTSNGGPGKLRAGAGQAGSSSLIENFFGFPTGISGGELTYSAQLQAYRFGAKFSTPAQALSLACG